MCIDKKKIPGLFVIDLRFERLWDHRSIDPLVEIRSQQLSGMLRVVRRFAVTPSSWTNGRRGRRRRHETIQLAVDYDLVSVAYVVSVQLLVRIQHLFWPVLRLHHLYRTESRNRKRSRTPFGDWFTSDCYAIQFHGNLTKYQRAGLMQGKEKIILISQFRAFYGVFRETKRSAKHKKEWDKIKIDRLADLIYVKQPHPIRRDFHHRFQLGFQFENRPVHVYGSNLQAPSIFIAFPTVIDTGRTTPFFPPFRGSIFFQLLGKPILIPSTTPSSRE